mmetsp:Transcript_10390/g.13459  ORF Transcript_10390/g.13459 Transcript_10390/m.13459 type:complete len:102 (+) Transcript_10390:57-362(+)
MPYYIIVDFSGSNMKRKKCFFLYQSFFADDNICQWVKMFTFHQASVKSSHFGGFLHHLRSFDEKSHFDWTFSMCHCTAFQWKDQGNRQQLLSGCCLQMSKE